MKPKIFYADESFGGEGLFAEQELNVSISVDTFRMDDRTPYRVFVESEPPEVRDLVPQIIANHKFYNLILAWNDQVLRSCPNAVKFLSPSAPWCGIFTPGVISYRSGMQNTFKEDALSPLGKQFEVSYVTSDKGWCPGHVLRQEVYHSLPASVGELRIDKHRSPPRISSRERAQRFETFQYHIAIENTAYNNNFTEKVLDCFLTRTLPLYWGCTNLSEYFNMDGVLLFDSYGCLVNLLENLTPDFYATHAYAMEDNYQRALQYVDYFGRVDSAVREHLKVAPQIETATRTRLVGGRLRRA